MTDDEILHMAHESGLIDFRDAPHVDYVQEIVEKLRLFSELVAAAEREKCAALTQKDEDEHEPVAWRCGNITHGEDGAPIEGNYWLSDKPEGQYQEPLYAAPPKRQPLTDEHEPVAVGEIVQRQGRRNVGGSDTGLGCSDGYVTDTWNDVEFYPFFLNDKRRFAPKWNEALEVGTKLYAAPPKRQPLTDEQIMDMCGTPAAIPGTYIYVVARAVEKGTRHRSRA